METTVGLKCIAQLLDAESLADLLSSLALSLRVSALGFAKWRASDQRIELDDDAYCSSAQTKAALESYCLSSQNLAQALKSQDGSYKKTSLEGPGIPGVGTRVAQIVIHPIVQAPRKENQFPLDEELIQVAYASAPWNVENGRVPEPILTNAKCNLFREMATAYARRLSRGPYPLSTDDFASAIATAFHRATTRKQRLNAELGQTIVTRLLSRSPNWGAWLHSKVDPAKAAKLFGNVCVMGSVLSSGIFGGILVSLVLGETPSGLGPSSSVACLILSGGFCIEFLLGSLLINGLREDIEGEV